VPTTADGDSDESDGDDQHPLSRDELQAKTMRGLAKREESSTKKLTQGGGTPARGSRAGKR